MDQAVKMQSRLNELARAEEGLVRARQALVRAQDSKGTKLDKLVIAVDSEQTEDILKANAQLYHASRWHHKKYGEYVIAQAEVKQARYQYNRICGPHDTKRCVMCGAEFIGYGEGCSGYMNTCSAQCDMTQDYPEIAE